MVISEWNKKDWDIFVDSSPQGMVFHKSYFLESYEQPVKYLRCCKGEENLAGLAFIELSDGMKLMPYQAFSGIIMRDFSGLDEYKRNENAFNILEIFAGYLFQRYCRVELINHWTIIDMRPFDWLNYH